MTAHVSPGTMLGYRLWVHMEIKVPKKNPQLNFQIEKWSVVLESKKLEKKCVKSTFGKPGDGRVDPGFGHVFGPFFELKSEKITKTYRCHQSKNGKKMPKMDVDDNSNCDVSL